MKCIPLGLQCHVPHGIDKANLREYSYPFDYLWTPSKTTYTILHILINDGIEKAIEYMTTGYTYYTYLGNENYESVNDITKSQMNKKTGLGITHFTINDDYRATLRRRLTKLLEDIKSNEKILFIYADAANPDLNYRLDNIIYGLDATEFLLEIYKLVSPLNKNIRIVYFCWNDRKKENNIIEYIPFEYKKDWMGVSPIITNYLLSLKQSSDKF
jgi:hypothetical protein